MNVDFNISVHLCPIFQFDWLVSRRYPASQTNTKTQAHRKTPLRLGANHRQISSRAKVDFASGSRDKSTFAKFRQTIAFAYAYLSPRKS